MSVISWKPVLYKKRISVPLSDPKVTTEEDLLKTVHKYVDNFILKRFHERYIFPFILAPPLKDAIEILRVPTQYVSIISSQTNRAHIKAVVKMYALIICPGLTFPINTTEINITLYDAIRSINPKADKNKSAYKTVLLTINIETVSEEKSSDCIKLVDFTTISQGVINAVAVKVTKHKMLPPVMMFQCDESENCDAILNAVGKPWERPIKSAPSVVVVKNDTSKSDLIMRLGGIFDYWTLHQ